MMMIIIIIIMIIIIIIIIITITIIAITTGTACRHIMWKMILFLLFGPCSVMCTLGEADHENPTAVSLNLHFRMSYPVYKQPVQTYNNCFASD